MSEKWRREQKKCTPGTMFYPAEPEIDWKAAREWAHVVKHGAPLEPDRNAARAIDAMAELIQEMAAQLETLLRLRKWMDGDCAEIESLLTRARAMTERNEG